MMYRPGDSGVAGRVRTAVREPVVCMERFVCIHGHFYQPPRENPWLEEVELQDSAYPYHDWNERITAECYAPNAASRLLDDEGLIREIVNNYEKTSFNFGPTLLSWMERHAPATLAAIVEADRRSQKRFSGHGSAIAQTYNHIIAPLANPRDKWTQVVWGIADFVKRFGRRPEGMWLAETAVDVETLDIMAEHGIRFTVLAPHQAARVRAVGENLWHDVSGGRVDPTRAYLQRLPSGRSIALFFYDGPVSRAVAFEGILKQGERFAERLMSGFNDSRPWAQLMHIAADGETYGHHHKHGEMALSYALEYIERTGSAKLTNYAEYLEKHPPQMEVEVFEHTAWSCAHGVERWKSDCGCTTGGLPGWNQKWRAPLRESLDWLRDRLSEAFERESGGLLRDCWAARDAYIAVILDRGEDSIRSFFAEHAIGEATGERRIKALKLLELSRQALLMFTSCGWFFDDLSRIETTQVLRYACRAMQLCVEVGGDDLEPRFLERLAAGRSNVPENGDGREVYTRFVLPARIDLHTVGAHFAMSSLFEEYAQRDRLYCYTVEVEDYQGFVAGRSKLAIGRVRIASTIVEESEVVSFGVLHLGDQNITASVRRYQGEVAYREMLHDLSAAFARADFTETIRALDKHFKEERCSVKLLFQDEQRRILDEILDSTLSQVEAAYRRMFDDHAPLMRFLLDSGVPMPRALRLAAEFVVNLELRRLLEIDDLDEPALRRMIDAARDYALELDKPSLSYAGQRAMERRGFDLLESPDDFSLLRECDRVLAVIETMPFEVNFWTTQNVFYTLLRTRYPQTVARGDEQAQRWAQKFREMCTRLRIRVG